PRASKVGSFCNSIVSNTAPAGTPIAINFSIASRLSCFEVHSPMMPSSSSLFCTRTSPVAKRGASIKSSRPVSFMRRVQVSGLDRRLVGPAGDANRAAGSLRDHVEGKPLLVRAAAGKTLDAAIEDARVDLLHRLVVEPQAFDRAGRHVLRRNVGLFQQLLDDFQSFWGFQIDRDRFFVGVELAKIPGIVIGLAGAQAAAGIAAAGVLDLDDFGAKPRQNLGAGRACLELREIDDLDALQKIKVLRVVAHSVSS